MKLKIPFVLVIICLTVLAIVYGAFSYITHAPIESTPTPVVSTETENKPILLTYRNETYGFEIQYPNTWQVSIDSKIPGIHIYKKSDTKPENLTHHSPFTHVSIYPQGIGTEGVQGKTSTTTIEFKAPLKNGWDYTLTDGKMWGTFATFNEQPESWQSWGFVWAGLKIDNEKIMCAQEGQPLIEGNCEMGVEFVPSQTVRSGSINSDDRKTEEQILASFRFIK